MGRVLDDDACLLHFYLLLGMRVGGPRKMVRVRLDVLVAKSGIEWVTNL